MPTNIYIARILYMHTLQARSTYVQYAKYNIMIRSYAYYESTMTLLASMHNNNIYNTRYVLRAYYAYLVIIIRARTTLDVIILYAYCNNNIIMHTMHTLAMHSSTTFLLLPRS